MPQQKFTVIQTITIEAHDVKEAASKATDIIRRSNSARYDVIDRAGYRFHVETTPASA